MTESTLRCVCSKHPLLGVIGRDSKTGAAFLHVKVFKQSRVFGEIVATSGVVRVRCRECLRWHEVTILHEVSVAEGPLPRSISV